MVLRVTALVPAAILAAVGLISAAVDRWAAPISGPQLERNANRYGSGAVRPGRRSYPREAVDSDGFRVQIDKPPKRIVSQYWSIDEYLYSIVPPQRVVAVSEYAYVRGTSNVYDLTQRFRPAVAADPERVLRQSPDLILVSSGGRSDFTSLVRSAGIPVYRMYTDFNTLNQIEENIRLIGYLTGEDDRAETEARRFRSVIEHAKALRRAGTPPPRILGIGGRYTYGSNTLFTDIVKTLGAVNVAAENGLIGYDSVNSEQIARWNPEWIVSGAAHGKIDEVRKRILTDPGVALTQAARTGHIVVFENNVFMSMSPYSTLRVTALAEALWN